MAVRWGHYKSEIAGGTGKYANAKGTLEYFGLADFGQQPPGAPLPRQRLLQVVIPQPSHHVVSVS